MKLLTLVFVYKNKSNTMQTWQGIITSHPHIMMGKPAIDGTRITVELIMEKLSEGVKTEELLQAYPHLTERQIQACLAYATDHLKFDVEYSLVS